MPERRFLKSACRGQPTKSNRRRQFSVGGLARDRGHRARLVAKPLQFNFPGHVGNAPLSRNEAADLAAYIGSLRQ
jgi:hypothetical protein